MGRFLDRYRRGEYKQVWDELLAQGESVRHEPLLTDASDVAHETMQRVRHNIEVLIPRLRTFGYQFGEFWGQDPLPVWLQEASSPEEGSSFLPFVPPHPEVLGYVEQLEQIIGPLPLSLRTYYLDVGGVNFLGMHPAWPEYLHQEMLDPLYIQPLTADVLENVLQDYAFYDPEDWVGTPFEIALAPDCYHKYNTSGGAPYTIAIPDRRIDGQFLNERHHTTFVDYLRTCFRSAGLPPLEVVGERREIAEALTYLRRDLLPI
ncbi:MAG TPA: hypothetical protein VFV38_39690 [Ktedonobacteraceae bacterium]|nr:hypothetical protein [Ktedonobacteraceae bacterium]